MMLLIIRLRILFQTYHTTGWTSMLISINSQLLWLDITSHNNTNPLYGKTCSVVKYYPSKATQE